MRSKNISYFTWLLNLSASRIVLKPVFVRCVLILLRLHVSLQPMRNRLWLLIVLLLLGTALRLYHVQAQSIWFDEGWSAYAAVQPTLRAAVEADATNPPLYYVLLNITTRAFGDSTLALRYFSLLFGVLAI